MVACCVHPDVRDSCVCSLRGVLLVHPPGSHKVVDRQYREFLVSLEQRGESLWELIKTLLRGPSYCAQLLSFLVDVLLSDYWAVLHSSSYRKPLFLSVFWSGSNQSNMTTSVKQLFGELTDLLQNFTASRDNDHRLDSLLTLIYLCDTVCADVSTSLLSMCQSLPSTRTLLLLGRLPSQSLYTHLTSSLTHIKQILTQAKETLNSLHRLATQTAYEKTSSTSLPQTAQVTEKASKETLNSSSRLATQTAHQKTSSTSLPQTAQVTEKASRETLNSSHRLATQTAHKKISSTSLPQTARLTEKASSQAVHKPVSIERSDSNLEQQSMDSFQSKRSSSDSDVAEQVVTWKTVTYGADKFPCLQMSKSPPKPKSQSPKDTTQSKLATIMKSQAPSSQATPCFPPSVKITKLPPSEKCVDLPSHSTSTMKSTKISDTKTISKTAPKTSKNAAVASAKLTKGLHSATASSVKPMKSFHKPPLVSNSKHRPMNGFMHSKGQVRSTVNGCVTQPKSSTLNKDRPDGPSHSSHLLKSTQSLPRPRQSVVAKPTPAPSHHCTSSTSQSKLDNRPPWKLGTSSSLTRLSLKEVRKLKSTFSTKTSSHAKKGIGGGKGGMVERHKSLVATGTVQRECENCVSGTCVNPTNTVHTLNV